MVKEEFISIEKARSLEESIMWLSNYTGPEEGVSHKVARNIYEKDVERTKLLLELGKINTRRQEIINELMTK